MTCHSPPNDDPLRYIGREVKNAVLAVPVGFNARQINATKQVMTRPITPRL